MQLEPGVLVTKRGRSGNDRSVHVRYVKLNSAVGNGGFGLEWKSRRLGLRRVFDLSRLAQAGLSLDSDGGAGEGGDGSGGSERREGEGANDGFVVLTNSSRQLKLKFPGELRKYFLHHIQSLCSSRGSQGCDDSS